MVSLEELTPPQLLPQEVHVKLAHLSVEVASSLALEIVTKMAASRVLSRSQALLIVQSASKDALVAPPVIPTPALTVDLEGSIVMALA